MAPKPEEIPVRNDNNGSSALKDINATTVLKVINIQNYCYCLHIFVILLLMNHYSSSSYASSSYTHCVRSIDALIVMSLFIIITMILIILLLSIIVLHSLFILITAITINITLILTLIL